MFVVVDECRRSVYIKPSYERVMCPAELKHPIRVHSGTMGDSLGLEWFRPVSIGKSKITVFLEKRCLMRVYQHSAKFRIINTIPPSAQAGREIIFVVGITNTGTETWVSGKSLVIRDLRDSRVRDIES